MILITFFSIALFGQSIEDFEKDFINATRTEFSETDLNNMYQTYSVFLEPYYDMMELMENDEQIVEYPLSKFKETASYKNNINILFNSKNDNQRLLSYLVIAGSGDKNFEKKLLERLKTEKSEGNVIWAGMTLMLLKSKQTTALFDFLVEYEDFGDAHMLPLFIQLDKESLQKTAYDRINSKNVKAKILAAQILSVTGNNKKTEKLLREAVKNWDYSIKGYAIYSMKELRIGNLKDDFIPLLDNPQTRSIAIQALANSPTKEDVDFVNQLLDDKGPVSEELLDGYYESKNIENVKLWLHLVSTREIPENYFFSVSEQPLLFSDELLKHVQEALRTTKNIQIQKYLIKVLEGRNDQESMDIIFAYLDSKDSSVRYWTVDTLKGKQPVEVLNKLIEMLKNPEQRVVSITDVLIENNIDSLQDIYEKIYQTDKSREWQSSSRKYLSNFPQQKHKKIFLEILENPKSDFFAKADASMGLANLKDESSVDLIIKACEEESAHSDYNARIFLIALSKIKGEKARKYIEKYTNSKEKIVKDLAKELIAGWDN